MKKFIIAAAAALVSLTACDILGQYPHNAKPKDKISVDDLALLHTGLYNMAQYKPGFEGYFQNDLAGGDFWRGGSTVFPSAAAMIVDYILPTNNWVNGPYTGYMACLYQINYFLSLAETAEQTRDVTEMMGTAYYFRGLIYYNLTSKYREVPVLRVNSKDPVAKSSEAECWAFVNENLENAVRLCPDYSSKNLVSAQAAKALAARAYLGQGNKSKAGEYAEELINDGRFALSKFEDIFRGEDNKEEIFTFSNLKEENGITFAGNFLKPATTYVPVLEVYESYSSADQRTPLSAYKETDGTYILYKYISKSTSDPIIVSRLAEMYLISAECKGLAGGGLDRLNQLRKFRGLSNASAADDAALLNAVLEERRLEFLGEGFRWFDLVRTGKYTSVTGLPEKYTVFPLPQREIDLSNNVLVQNELWK